MALASAGAMMAPVPFLRDIEKEGKHSDFRAGAEKKEKTHVDDRRKKADEESDDEYLSDYTESTSDDSSDESDEGSESIYDGPGGDEETKDDDSEKSDGEETPATTATGGLGAGGAKAKKPSYREKIEMWRRRKRKARRHPTLVYYERLLAKEQAQADADAVEKADVHEYDRIRAREKYERDEEIKNFLLKVQQEDWARYQRMCVQRQKELDNTTQRMRLFERWDLQRGVEEKRERAEAAAIARAREEKEAARKVAEAREAQKVAAEAARALDEADTQATLRAGKG